MAKYRLQTLPDEKCNMYYNCEFALQHMCEGAPFIAFYHSSRDSVKYDTVVFRNVQQALIVWKHL